MVPFRFGVYMEKRRYLFRDYYFKPSWIKNLIIFVIAQHLQIKAFIWMGILTWP